MWSLQRETGFTHDYILWGEPWVQLMLKVADAPKYITKKKKEASSSITVEDTDTDDDVDEKLMNFFNENK